MKYDEQIETLLKASGAILARQHKHLVYKLPNGKTFVKTNKLGDVRASRNALSDLRKLLGVKREIKHSTRIKTTKHPRHKQLFLVNEPTPNLSSLSSALDLALNPRKPQLNIEVVPLTTAMPRRHRRRHPVEVMQTYTPTPEVRLRANEILAQQGEKAMHDFLNKHRHEFQLYNPYTNQEKKMDRLEELVANAKIEIRQLDTRHENARKQVEFFTSEMKSIDEKKKELDSFLAAYSMAIEQSEVVKKILPAEATATKGTLVKRSGRASSVVTISLALLESGRDKVNAEDVWDYAQKNNIKFTNKQTVFAGLNYDHNNPKGKLIRVGTGYYGLRGATKNGHKAVSASA